MSFDEKETQWRVLVFPKQMIFSVSELLLKIVEEELNVYWRNETKQNFTIKLENTINFLRKLIMKNAILETLYQTPWINKKVEVILQLQKSRGCLPFTKKLRSLFNRKIEVVFHFKLIKLYFNAVVYIWRRFETIPGRWLVENWLDQLKLKLGLSKICFLKRSLHYPELSVIYCN